MSYDASGRLDTKTKNKENKNLNLLTLIKEEGVRELTMVVPEVKT